MSKTLLAYYGDDFTGSTDTLEVLAWAGLEPVLFTSPPTVALLEQYPHARAVGLAGISRSLSSDEMAVELHPAFKSLVALNPRHFHYKVCSTFDSSPNVGSIGRAIDIGIEYSGAKIVPLLVGNPRLGRYSVFGNLFAQVGVGHSGQVYRLDRHPTARSHPVTPMSESDLRLHLAKQTNKQVALFDVLDLDVPSEDRRKRLEQALAYGAEILLLDALYPEHLGRLGEILDNLALAAEPLFSVGSSGLQSALCEHWCAARILAGRNRWKPVEAVNQVLVVSGSCSPVTAAQIEWAVSQGFAELILNPCVLTDEECNSYLLQVAENLVNLISEGRSVVVHTGQESLSAELARVTSQSLIVGPLESKARQSRLLGTALGRLVSVAAEQTGIKRVCLAGGDTASYATREMGISSLQMVCPTTPGAPLCEVQASGKAVEKLEICFKGGQVGLPDYFGSLLQVEF